MTDTFLRLKRAALPRVFLLLGAALASSALRADPLVDPGTRYDTADMIVATVQALPRCLRYCLLGFEIRVRYTGYTVEVYVVPRVEHYMTALHVMTSDRFPREAYLEWAAIVGTIQQQLLDAMAHAIPPRLGGVPIDESSGGRTRHGQYGHHQSTNFKESEFMGHPVAILPALVDKNGDMTAASYRGGGTGANGGDDFEAFGFITQWVSWSTGCFLDPKDLSRNNLYKFHVDGRMV